MLGFLNQLDTQLFIFFNVNLANPVFDVLMPFITDARTWYPVWLVLIVGLLWKGGAKGRWVVLIALLSVALADQVVNQLMKPFFDRIRPCNVIEIAHLPIGKSGSPSMPSSHAANFFTTATIFAYYYRRYQLVYWFLASLVAYSRVAVGRHYPFDIIVGAISGVIFALFWIYTFKMIFKGKGKSLV